MEGKADAFALAVLAFAPGADQSKYYSAHDIHSANADSFRSRLSTWKVPGLAELQGFLSDAILRKAALKACGGGITIEFKRSTNNTYQVRFLYLTCEKALSDADLKSEVAALSASIILAAAPPSYARTKKPQASGLSSLDHMNVVQEDDTVRIVLQNQREEGEEVPDDPSIRPSGSKDGPMEEGEELPTEPHYQQRQGREPDIALEFQQHTTPMQGVQQQAAVVPSLGSGGRGRKKQTEAQLRTEVKRLQQSVRRLHKSLKVARAKILKLRGVDSETFSDDDLRAAGEDEELGGGEQGGGPSLEPNLGGQEDDDDDDDSDEGESFDESERIGELLVDTVEQIGVFTEPVNGFEQLSRKSAMVLQSLIVDCGVSAEKLPLALTLFLQLYFGDIDPESYASLNRSTPTIQKAVDRIGNAVKVQAASNFTDRESKKSFQVKLL